MKALPFSSLALTALLFASSPAFAQTPDAAAPAATAPAEKAKPMGSAERSFMKKALESAYVLINLSDKHKAESLRSTDTKAVAVKMNADLNKLWEEMSPLSMSSGDKLPEAVSPGDKSKIEKLAKANLDKYDKEWLKIATRESKQLAATFTAATRLSDPTIKTLVATWEPQIKALNEDAEKAEKAAAKIK